MRYQLIVAASLIGATPALAQESAVVVRNATVETLAGAGRLEKATVVVQDGKIVAVGTDVKVPDGATVIDAKGGTLLPGIIDPHYEITIAGGATEDAPAAPPMGRGGRGNRGGAPAGPAARGDFARIADNFYPYDSAYKALPRAGLTHLNLVSNGVGQSAVVRITPTQPDQMMMQPDGVAYAVVTNSSDSLDQVRTRLEAAESGRPRAPIRGGGGGGGGGRAGRGGGRGGRAGRGGGGGGGGGGAGGPPTDADTHLWERVHAGETPLIASVNGAAAIVQLMRVLEPYNKVKLVLYTNGDAIYESIGSLKGRNVCAVLRPALDLVPNTRDRFNAARMLHEAGVEVAFSLAARTPGGGGAAAALGAGVTADPEPAGAGVVDQDFPLFPVAMLVKTGLPRATALEALTKRPATILGLDKTYGTIEPGKAADLLLFSGDPLDPSSRLRLTLIDGRTAYAN